MNQVVIEARNLGKEFGSFKAVQNVSFQVARGSIFGLLGPNGSGKSTLIRMLLGILPATEGEARVFGCDAQKESELVKPNVGYMSQHFGLYADLSVLENIEFYGRIYGLDRNRLKERTNKVVELTSLADYLHQIAGTLSGGWQRRLALACALVHEPALLFLDEPTAGIDPVSRRHLWDLLFELSGRGVTLFVTTHYMDEAERCTDVGYMYLSKLLVLGKPNELKKLPAVTPQGTRRYEIQTPMAAERLSQVRTLEGVLDATLFGGMIHVLVLESVTPEQLTHEMGGDNQETSVREVAASLEDVFVTLTAKAESSELISANLDPPQDRPKEETVAPSHWKSSKPPTKKQSTATHGLLAILVKEFFHIRRQPITLFFMFVVPVMQIIIFGYAIDTQIEHIPTVVFDMDGRRDARELIASFENTRKFRLIEHVQNQEQFDRALKSGRAKVGIRIPPNYSNRMLAGEQTQIQVLIDGSDSQVATTALTTVQLLGLKLSIQIARAKGESLQIAPSRDEMGHGALPIETRARLLYNPDLDSSHFFVPGLVGIVLQLVTLFLTSFAIVRERELGSLEQLFVTPVGRLGLLLGKLLPYALVGFVELLIILTVMIYGFGVPIHGSVWLLLGLSFLFLICSLGLGLLVSTLAKTQLEAVQFAFVIMLPSILLSGFIFPRSEMPLPIYLVTFAIPATYFIEILRGVVLRGADFVDLVPAVVGLTICSVAILILSTMRFRKQLV